MKFPNQLAFTPYVNKFSLGFTIIELMIVLAIASVLLMFSVPTFVSSSVKSSIRANMGNLSSDLAYARSSAITRSNSVSLCPSNVSITPQACGNGTWEDGWLTFFDDNDSGVLDSGEEIIRVSPSVGRNVSIRLDNSIRFSSRGLTNNVSEFVFCNSQDDSAFYAKSLVINLAGLIRTSRDTDSDGVQNGGEGGGNLSCL